ncbi:ATP-dependent DNA ligase [Candidatus Woesearchaeota archaeon]|nr:MAG: ATP-dependent DNA ligase [Candidatus Woesearchaeota archaeon]
MDYLELTDYYQKLENTAKRLEKTYLVSELLKKTPEKDLTVIMHLLRGSVFPDWDERKTGIAERLIIKAINVATGISADNIEQEWKKKGDLGNVAEKLAGKKSQATLFQKTLTVQKVFDNIRKLAEMEGQGTVDRKMQLLAELLSQSTTLEARYIVRTALGDLRIGLGDGSLRDAIAWAYLIDPHYDSGSITPDNREAYNKVIESVQTAYNNCNDFATVAIAAKKNTLEKVSLILGQPVKVMLAPKAKNIADGFERVGKPAQIEYKYDGFRVVIHKAERISIFTRRLENVTKQFPEVVEALKNVKGDNYIIDCEAVGFDKKTGKYLPFQHISQRIRRKYGIDELSKTMPVELNVFDVLYYNGKSYLNEPFEKRRVLLEKIIKSEQKKIVLAAHIVTDDEKKADAFYKQSLKAGNEGIMMKNLQGIYKPGSRVGFMVKVKPVMETLDLVITGAEWGEGKRSGWLTSFTLSCMGEDGYLDIGKVGTGIKELESEEGVTFEELTNLLKPLIKEEKGKTVKVKPKIVVSINYEEIQKSPTYGSGYALRFPRVVAIRPDLNPEEVASVQEIDEFYTGQKK